MVTQPIPRRIERFGQGIHVAFEHLIAQHVLIVTSQMGHDDVARTIQFGLINRPLHVVGQFGQRHVQAGGLQAVLTQKSGNLWCRIASRPRYLHRRPALFFERLEHAVVVFFQCITHGVELGSNFL